MMRLYRSNRAERLVAQLAELVAAPAAAADPFQSEWVVVQSRGMERWLSMQLAGQLGVWANPHFPFPRAMISRLLDAAVQDEASLETIRAGAQHYDEATLTWTLAAALPDYLGRNAGASGADAAEGFQLIERYLEGGDSSRLFQLCRRLSRLFDDYCVYRPDLVLRWQQGQDEHWQAILWRDLVQRHGEFHTAARMGRFHAAAASGGLRLESLPSRIHLFGISALPPAYVGMLAALPAQIQVSLFLPSPCRWYWGDIRSPREAARILARAPAATDAAAQHLEEGHPLLASLGGLGREFIQVLFAGDQDPDDTDLHEPVQVDSLLTALQSDILELSAPDTPRTIAALDDSLEIHSCHAPLRELEVLHDRLLHMFERDRSLHPRDVVVMTPDIEAYAPLVEAVFGVRAGGAAVPYRVADRTVTTTHAVIDAFFQLLTALPSRMGAGSVLDLLVHEPIRARFGIEPEDLDVLRDWVADCGIRWGIDGEHRQAEDQPGYEQNTWRFGLERLFLGYAMETGGDTLYQGRLPHGAAAGGDGALLGCFADFCETLFALHGSLERPRSAGAWRQDLGRLIERLLLPDPVAAYQAQALRDALGELETQAELAGFDGELTLATVAELVEDSVGTLLSPRVGAQGFLSGGVTFCQLTPMRSVPFRVVCIVGMNDDAFPRDQAAQGFDLMARHPRLGDRSRRNDDRYLFLEALMSARERVVISYVGQGIHDNRVRPPSVVVAELLDVVRRGFVVEGAVVDDGLPSVEARLVIRHPLQAFSPRYFRSDRSPEAQRRLYSYAAHYCGAASALCRKAPPAAFLTEPLLAEDGNDVELSLDQFEAYLSHPIRAFMQRKLGLYLGRDAQVAEEREPIELDSLQRWKLGTDLLLRAPQQQSRQQLLELSRAAGGLPLGTPGELSFEREAPLAHALHVLGVQRADGPARVPVPVELQLQGVRLHGALRHLHRRGQVEVHYSKVGTRGEFGYWIRHLVLNHLCDQGGLPDDLRQSYWIGKNKAGDAPKVVCYGRVDDALGKLRSLMDVQRMAQRGCLPFLWDCSYTLASACVKDGKSESAAIDAARSQFVDQQDVVKDLYAAQVFEDFDAMLAVQAPVGFVELALCLLRPMLEARSTE